MDYRELFIQSITSLRKNVMRTGLTMLGIVIGISSVILIVSIGQGAVQFVTNELSSFGTNYFQITPGSSAFSSFAAGQKSLTLADAEAIQNDRSLTNVDQVISFTSASVVVSANEINKRPLVYGITANGNVILNSIPVYGEFFTEEDDQTSSRVAVIGIDMAEEFYGEETNPVGETIRVDGKPFRVVGVIKSESSLFAGFFNSSVVVPLSVMMSQIVGQDAGLQEIDVTVHNTDLINQTIEDVEFLLRERHNLSENDEDDFTIQSFQDALATVQTITTLLAAVVTVISGISLIVGGVGVMNIMLVTVTERTKEIGLLKAIGAKEKDILMQFLMESVVITVIGGAIGIVIGIAGAFLVSLAGVPFIVSVPAILIAVGVSAGVGIVFGLYPARKAAKLSPIDALRYE